MTSRQRTSPPGHPARRARLMVVAIAFVLSLFVAQIVRLQALDAPDLAEAAMATRLSTERIPALRGDIVDTGGTVMARSVSTRHVTADPTLLEDFEGDEKAGIEPGVHGASRALAEVLDASAGDIATRLESVSGRFVYLAKDVTPQTWREIDALGLPGISSEPSSTRTYPLGSTSAPLVGWVNAQQEGSGGIEAMGNELLAGTPGTMVYQQSATGGRIATTRSEVTGAQPGDDLRLTMNADIQHQAESLLAEQVEKMGAESGTAVVQRTNGDLLAVASTPGFDPTTAVEDPVSRQHPAFTDVFEPGSTGKVITAAAALEEGLVAPATRIVVPERLPRSDQQFRDSHDEGTKYLTFAGVLAASSNIGTILAGEELGPDALHDFNEAFGLGKPSGLGFPGESAGLLAPAEDWSQTQYYTVMFGQGVSLTPIQQAGVFQTIANDGVRVPPRILEATRSAGDEWVEGDREPGERVVSEKTATQLQRMLAAVATQEGTAPKAQVPGYQVAGKTSTAERYDPESGGYDGVTASFAGFAPAHDPQVVISISIQKPETSIWGGEVAAPVFSSLMGYTLRAEGVPPTSEPFELPQLTFDPAELVDQEEGSGTRGNQEGSESESAAKTPVSPASRSRLAPGASSGATWVGGRELALGGHNGVALPDPAIAGAGSRSAANRSVTSREPTS